MLSLASIFSLSGLVKGMVKGLNWKLVLGVAGALCIVAAAWAAFSYVSRISDALSASQTALAHEQRARVEADARAAQWQRDFEEATARLGELTRQNQASAARIAQLTKTIRHLNLKELADADPADAAGRLDALNRNLNRLLEGASAGGHARADADHASTAAEPGRP